MSYRAAVLSAGLFLASAGFVQAQEAECPALGWGRFLHPGPQSYAVTEVVATAEGTRMVGITFGALEGEYAKLFLFLHMEGDCYLEAVSHGSYAYLVDGETGARSYHLDLYSPGMHATLGMSKEPLDYATARALAAGRWGVE